MLALGTTLRRRYERSRGSEYVTLDGVMEEPGRWRFQFWSEESAKFKCDELFASDAMLLGRVAYQGFAKAWPAMTDEAGFADRMNRCTLLPAISNR